MGLFDFVRNAGGELFGGDDEKKEAAEDPKQANQLSQISIIRRIRDAGIEVSDLMVVVDDDLATISGQVATQEDCEKATLAAGNQMGIARVDCQIEVQEADAPEAQMYAVKSGDSLSEIAKSVYGDAMKYPLIFEANKPLLSDPDKIYPGQVLRIPAVE